MDRQETVINDLKHKYLDEGWYLVDSIFTFGFVSPDKEEFIGIDRSSGVICEMTYKKARKFRFCRPCNKRFGMKIDVFSLTFIVLLVLKLCGLAAISWWWVFSPFLIVMGFLLVALLVTGVVFFVCRWLERA